MLSATFDDAVDGVTAFRVAGGREDVADKLAEMAVVLPAGQTMRVMGPFQWGEVWVAHGEINGV